MAYKADLKRIQVALKYLAFFTSLVLFINFGEAVINDPQGSYYQKTNRAEIYIIDNQPEKALEVYIEVFDETGYLFNIDLYNALLLHRQLDNPLNADKLYAFFFSKLQEETDMGYLEGVKKDKMNDPVILQQETNFHSSVYLQLYNYDQCFYSGEDRFCSRVDSPFTSESDLLQYIENIFLENNIPFPGEIPFSDNLVDPIYLPGFLHLYFKDMGDLDSLLIQGVREVRIDNDLAAYLLDYKRYQYGTKLFAYYNDTLYVEEDFDVERYNSNRRTLYLSTIEEFQHKLDFMLCNPQSKFLFREVVMIEKNMDVDYKVKSQLLKLKRLVPYEIECP